MWRQEMEGGEDEVRRQEMEGGEDEVRQEEARSENEEMEQFLLEISQWYDGKEYLPPLLLYQKELEELIRLGIQGYLRARVTAIAGRKGCGRKFLLMTAARAFRKGIFMVDGDAVLRLYAQYGASVLSFFAWKATQNDCMLCLTDCTAPEELEFQWRQLLVFFIRQGISFWLTWDTPVSLPEDIEYEYTEIRLEEPTPAERAALWRYFLEEAQEEHGLDTEKLGACYRLHCGEIQQVLRSAVLGRLKEGRGVLCEEDIRKAARLWKRAELAPLAVKLPCVFSWEDLVVDEGVSYRLHEICNLLRYQNVVGAQWGFCEKHPYGNGVCVLFYGPSGTGKTMAAQVVARELGLELYRVDLSQMNSKYIGETQKNLHALFARAQEMNVILFFDEAEAFFTKRTGVRDANDRHANGEVSYLLQRLETYQGITILATNLKNQFDDAFRRRIRRMVYFPLPDCDTRKRMWEKAFPMQAPLSREINFEIYAKRFEISAGEIKEAARDAAFLAAAEGNRIEEKHIREALRFCYEKYGRVLAESDFE